MLARILRSTKVYLLIIIFGAILAARADAAAKYVFIFIGDGMGVAQVNAAEAFLAGTRSGDAAPRSSQLAFTSMPHSGMITTSSKSGTTDSAAAATALATGRKTVNGAICTDPTTGEDLESILSVARRAGMKTGVVSTAFLQDATPAAFAGARATKRTEHYRIGIELCEAGHDFLGGGGFRSPKGRDGKSASLIEIAKKNGYVVTTTAEEFWSLVPTRYPADAPSPTAPPDSASPTRRSLAPIRAERALAIHPRLSSGSMPFAIDEGENVAEMSLSDFTRRAIMMLDGPDGFVLAVEGGRIDIACHANDAASAVREVIELDRAVAAALEFASAHEDETLIIVTADHETGGMTIADLAPSTLARLSAQRGSYLRFEGRVEPRKDASIADHIAMAREWFGAGLTDETPELRAAFRVSMTPKKQRDTKSKEHKKNYATYDPFTVAAIHDANAALGITWTTFYHTGKNVPIFAQGVGAESFAGSFDNTEVFDKIIRAMDI